MLIKESLVLPFLQFIRQDGFILTPTQGCIQARRGKKVGTLAKVSKDFYEMNAFAAERYNVFLEFWLKNGVSAIEDLRQKGKKDKSIVRFEI